MIEVWKNNRPIGFLNKTVDVRRSWVVDIAVSTPNEIRFDLSEPASTPCFHKVTFAIIIVRYHKGKDETAYFALEASSVGEEYLPKIMDFRYGFGVKPYAESC